jgi:hypothetical protein
LISNDAIVAEIKAKAAPVTLPSVHPLPPAPFNAQEAMEVQLKQAIAAQK